MDEARKINNYTIEHSFNVGEREVFFGVDEKREEPFVVAYAEYFSPMDVYMMNQPEHYKDYLSAMMDYCSRCTEQVKAVQEEHGKFGFSLAPFTAQDCIPCPSDESIIGKVVVMDVSKNRREYRHCAYQLVLAEAGNSASGGRGSAVFLDAYPDLKAMYSAEDDNTEVFYMTDVTATFASFTKAPEEVKF